MTKAKSIDEGPYCWLRKFEKVGFINEDIHESTFHFLDRATAEDFNFKDLGYLEDIYSGEKRKSELSMIAKKERFAVSFGENIISILLKKEYDRINQKDAMGDQALLLVVLLSWVKDFSVDKDGLPYSTRSILLESNVLGHLKNKVYLTNPQVDLGAVDKYLKEAINNYLIETEIGYKKDRKLRGYSKQAIQELSQLELCNSLFLLGTFSFKNADVELDIYINMFIESIGKHENTKPLKDQYILVRDYIDLSIFCFLSIYLLKQQLERPTIKPSLASKEFLSEANIIYKLKYCDYLVEAGMMLLELGRIKNLLGIEPTEKDNSNAEKYKDLCFTWAMDSFRQAEAILRETELEEIGRKKIRLQMARSWQLKDDFRRALILAQQAKSENPVDYEVLTVLGEIFCSLKEYKFGLGELESALSFKPNDPNLLLRVGQAYYHAGKDCREKGDVKRRLLEKARTYMNEALEIEEKTKIAQRRKIRYWIGKTLMEMGRYDDAIPHFRILCKLDISSPLIELYLGYAYIKSNAYEEGEQILSNLIRSKINPSIAIVYGRRVDDAVDTNELLARAHIYLAYSYALRCANFYKSWKIACQSQEYIRNMKEENHHKKSPEDDLFEDDTCMSPSLDDYILSIPEPHEDWMEALEDFSCLKCDKNYYKHSDCPLIGLQRHEIVIERNASDGPRKRKVKSNLAKCAGLICSKMGYYSQAIKYLEFSISLYPDAEAYFILAKAWHGRLLQGTLPESQKALIDRKILDLCRHVQELDVKQKYGPDLDEFKKGYEKKPPAPASEGSAATDKSVK